MSEKESKSFVPSLTEIQLLARDNYLIRHVVEAARFHNLSWEETLAVMVKVLLEENNRIMETTVTHMKYCPMVEFNPRQRGEGRG